MFEEYLKLNNKKTLIYFKNYCFKKYSNKLNKEDIEDIYNDCIIKVLESKAHKNSLIENYHSYFLTVLKMETIQILKKQKTHDSISEDFNLIEDNENGVFNCDGFEDLIIKSKTILSNLEYQIFMMSIMNNLTYREIAKKIEYSASSVYLRNKDIIIKIKKEIKKNNGKYFN